MAPRDAFICCSESQTVPTVFESAAPAESDETQRDTAQPRCTRCAFARTALIGKMTESSRISASFCLGGDAVGNMPKLGSAIP